MSQILPRLYLGSLKELSELDRLGITHVVSLLNPDFISVDLGGRDHFSFNLDDTEEADLLAVFEHGVLEYIRSALKSGGVVYVHCFAGVSRSASVVTAFVMQEFGEGVEAAIKRLQAARPSVNPNPAFIAQLKLFEEWGNRIALEAAAKWRSLTFPPKITFPSPTLVTLSVADIELPHPTISDSLFNYHPAEAPVPRMLIPYLLQSPFPPQEFPDQISVLQIPFSAPLREMCSKRGKHTPTAFYVPSQIADHLDPHVQPFAIILLGTGDRQFFKRRLDRAVKLALAHPNALIFWVGTLQERDEHISLLDELHVPAKLAQRIVLNVFSVTTRCNLAIALALMKGIEPQRKWRATIVSDDWHLPRALLCAAACAQNALHSGCLPISATSGLLLSAFSDTSGCVAMDDEMFGHMAKNNVHWFRYSMHITELALSMPDVFFFEIRTIAFDALLGLRRLIHRGLAEKVLKCFSGDVKPLYDLAKSKGKDHDYPTKGIVKVMHQWLNQDGAVAGFVNLAKRGSSVMHYVCEAGDIKLAFLIWVAFGGRFGQKNVGGKTPAMYLSDYKSLSGVFRGEFDDVV